MSISNQDFWDRRYTECPELGSGPGSRGYVVIKKKKLVISALNKLGASSILDVGCGDLCWLDKEIFESYKYIGLDVSSVVINNNKRLWPNVKFSVHNIVNEPSPCVADFVVCFDVLIHQERYEDFLNALKNTLMAAKIGALISYKKSPMEPLCYESDPDLTCDGARLEQEFQSQRIKIGKVSGMKATYHNDLKYEILKIFPMARISKIDSYRSQNVYLVTGVASD